MKNADLSTVVAKNAKEIMLAKGLKQADVATDGLSQKTVSNILAGANDSDTRPKSMTLEKLEKLAHGLGVEPWKLLADFSQKKWAAWDSFEALLDNHQVEPSIPTAAPALKKSKRLSTVLKPFKLYLAYSRAAIPHKRDFKPRKLTDSEMGAL